MCFFLTCGRCCFVQTLLISFERNFFIQISSKFLSFFIFSHLFILMLTRCTVFNLPLFIMCILLIFFKFQHLIKHVLFWVLQYRYKLWLPCDGFFNTNHLRFPILGIHYDEYVKKYENHLWFPIIVTLRKNHLTSK